jgi:adenylate cyclase
VKLAALSVLAAWTVCAVLMVSQAWEGVEIRLFDWFSVVTAPRRSSLPITIIGIDEASIDKIGKPWPWPRDVHAQLVDRLVQAKASVIAFDVLFSEPASAQEDEAFARAIRSAGNVVLAADRSYMETAEVRQWHRIDPAPALGAAGAVAGVRATVLDEDAVIRVVPDDDDAFWRQVIHTLVRTRPGMVQEPYVASGSLLRHLGPARTFPYVSYHQVLSGDPAIPENFFKDQVVLIGRDVRATLAANSTVGDMFATPFLKTSHVLTPGVEIQATLIENALMGQTISPASIGHNILLLSVALAFGGMALVFWHPLRSGVLILLTAMGVAGLSAWLFTAHAYWQFTAAPVLGLVLSFSIMGAASYWGVRRRVTVLRRAFKKYVSADLVNEIVANQGNLKLGGDRRELTVLFCDLTGFTTLCEKLSPEGVADLINLYANEMTRIVMAHGGTVDKFIGDSVMAFWGAPLQDPQQALHAVNAAIAMQEAMDQLQPKFSAMGLTERLALRIGLHSGMAIVGNMGSDLRFEYTALGDTVNLASRLEGANKTYGTRILLSGSTAEQLGHAVGLRRVDRVRVKGKQVAVDIFTPCANERLVQLSELAWRAYDRRDYPAAAAAWTEVQVLDAYDPLAAVFESRLATLQKTPPPPDWDGATLLDKA